IRPPSPQRPEAKHLDQPQARRLADLARDDDLEGAVTLGLFGGLRLAESLVLSWRDVNLETREIVVASSFWGATKNGKIRSFRLNDSAVAALRRTKRHQAERLLALGIRQTEDTTVVTNHRGEPATPKWLETAFGRFCDQHSVDLTYHGLRHTN